MREIIVIQVGNCGNQIGTKFWREISREHEIDFQGIPKGEDVKLLQRREVYYDELKTGNFAPRAILVDTDLQYLKESVRAGSAGILFPETCYVASGLKNQSSKGNYAIGRLEVGPELASKTMESIRKMLENCDRPQGFHLIHSLGGGTGSGTGARIMSKISEDYSELITHNFSVFPSFKVTENVLQPYNAMLSMIHLQFNYDGVHCLDNSAIYDHCRSHFPDKNSIEQMGEICAMNLSSLTTSFRFNGDVFDTLAKMTMNMVPFPYQHFFLSGFSPFYTGIANKTPTIAELTQEVFKRSNSFVDCEIEKGKLISGLTTFRGHNSLIEIDEAIEEIKSKSTSMFKKCIPENLKNLVCDVKIRDYRTTAGLLANHSSITNLFKCVVKNFNDLWQNKRYLHLYKGEGLDEIEFTESRCGVLDLISEYDMMAEDDDDSDNDDDDDDKDDDDDDDKNDGDGNDCDDDDDDDDDDEDAHDGDNK